MLAIFFLPSSPSRCISSSFGIAIVRSCIMMEDVIYGVILNANTDISLNDPPVIASKKLNAPFVCELNHSANKAESIPGQGSCEPNRITISIKNVYTNRSRISLTLNAPRSVCNIRSPLLFHQELQSFPLH